MKIVSFVASRFRVGTPSKQAPVSGDNAQAYRQFGPRVARSLNKSQKNPSKPARP